MNILERLARRIAQQLRPVIVTAPQLDVPTVVEQLRQSLSGMPVQVGYPHPYHDLNTNLAVLTLMSMSDYLHRHLYTNDKYVKSKRVTHYAKKFYSMAGEDGVIREICRRIGVERGQFVEFGVDMDGLENNTLYLLHKGWTGLWIEAHPNIVQARENSFRHHIQTQALVILNERVSAERIEAQLERGHISREFDLLSIDIDGNDYWIWAAIKSYRPKIVVIEFNSVLGDEVSCVMPYDANHAWTGSYYMGASLKALEKLGREKGYCLVGCDYHGVNAYFVREDLVEDKFEAPFTTENHYEPLRVFLTRGGGSLRGFGRFEQV